MRYLILIVSGLTLGSIYSLIAIGFNLVFRTTGLIDFAQGDKAVLGGLVALSLINLHIPMPLVILTIVLLGIGFGALYDQAVIRPAQRHGPSAAVVGTVGASLVIGSAALVIWGPSGIAFPPITAGGFQISSLQITYQTVWIWGTLAVVVTALLTLMKRTRFGKGMVAAASDPLAAVAVGISIRAARLTSFAIATALAALAGILIAPITLAGGGIGGTLTIKGFTGAVLGGIDNTIGVVGGSLILGVTETMLQGELSNNGYVDPIVFGLLLVVLLVAPTGLFGARRGRLA